MSQRFATLSHYIAHELQRSLETNRYTLFLVLENERDKGKFVAEFSALGTGLEPFLETPPTFESFKRAFLSETGNE
ncbi:MAG: hypothetical protein C4331_04840 [Meiothermus sp.]